MFPFPRKESRTDLGEEFQESYRSDANGSIDGRDNSQARIYSFRYLGSRTCSWPFLSAFANTDIPMSHDTVCTFSSMPITVVPMPMLLPLPRAGGGHGDDGYAHVLRVPRLASALTATMKTVKAIVALAPTITFTFARVNHALRALGFFGHGLNSVKTFSG